MREVTPGPDVKWWNHEKQVGTSLLGAQSLAHQTVRGMTFDSSNEFEPGGKRSACGGNHLLTLVRRQGQYLAGMAVDRDPVESGGLACALDMLGERSIVDVKRFSERGQRGG